MAPEAPMPTAWLASSCSIFPSEATLSGRHSLAEVTRASNLAEASIAHQQFGALETASAATPANVGRSASRAVR